MPDQSRAHTALVNRVWERISPMCLASKMQPAGAPDMHGKPARTGPLGIGDVMCVVLTPSGVGRHVELECKTGKADLNKNQLVRQYHVRKFGGVHEVVRSPDQAAHIIDRVAKGTFP